ncbi:MAG: amino acid adenylation domain-containing protein [Myxococcales bacterium]|nr:amino acid adenylation domain-containing protein [Myxococcales bacterium]
MSSSTQVRGSDGPRNAGPSSTGEPSDRTALTQRQFLMWLGHDAAPEFPASNMLMSFILDGAIDQEAFVVAFQRLVDSTDALRTVVVTQAGRPYQRVLDTLAVSIDMVDLTAHSDPMAAYRQLRDRRSTRAFDLERCCFDTALVRLGPQRYVWYLCQHHLITDGTATSIIYRRMSELYAEQLGGATVDTDRWPRFADTLTSFQKYVGSKQHDRDEAYWRPKLKQATQPLRFYGEPQTPSSYYIERESLPLGPARSARLRELGSAEELEGMTPEIRMWVLVQTALFAYLYRVGGETDLAIGAPMRNRSSRQAREVVGPTIEICPLQVGVDEGESFRSLHTKAAKETFAALRHGRHCTSNPSHCRVFEATLNFHLMSFGPFAGVPTRSEFHSGLHAMPLPPAAEATPANPVDALGLQLHDFDGTGNYTLDFDFNGQLIDAEQRQRAVQHFLTLFDAMLEDMDQPLDGPGIVTEGERARLLDDWNDTARDYPLQGTLHGWFAAQVAKTPDATALVFEGSTLSYRALHERSNQLARHLQGLGVGRGTLVGVAVERSLELVIGLFGILKAGGAYVPMDPEYPADRLAYMLDNAQVPVLLTQASLVDELPAHDALDLCLDRDWSAIACAPVTDLPSPSGPDDTAYVIYTSGSTGKPKGVANTHRGICNRLLWMQEEYGLGAGDRVLQKTPFSFDVSVWEFFWPMMTGARLVVAKPGGHRDNAYMIDLIVEQGITTMHFVPPMLQVFLAHRDVARCTSLVRVICSGEALPFEAQTRFFERLDAELHNLYGPTEAAVDVTYWACDRDTSLPFIPIGRPVANTKIYILDRRLQHVPIGVAGELHIGGVQVAEGYLHRPELTAEKFIEDPYSSEHGGRMYKTGDLARFMPDGNVEYLGRIDNQVKLRGFRIELGEIETVLAAAPAVEQATVIVREDQPGAKRLVAYVIPSASGAPSPEDLRAHLAESLPDYMVPQSFVTLEAFPLTPNGKIDRRALPMPVVEQGEASDAPPRNELESKLADLFAEVLRLEQVGIDANFFDLGGHSLLAASLVGRIEETLGARLPLGALFDAPTVAQLAEALSAGEVKTRALMCLKATGEGTPLFYVGSALQGRWLAEQLEEDTQPVYGLNFFGLDLDESQVEVPNIAKLFLDEVRTVRPRGPYRLCAYCADAKLAYEMAAQLERAGEEVDRMIFVDTRWGERPGRPSVRSVVESTIRLGPGYLAHRIWRRVRTLGDRVEEAQLKLRNRFSPDRDAAVSTTLRHDRLIHIFMDKLVDYPASPIDSQITLLQTLEGSSRGPVALRSLARGGIDVQLLSGYHGQIFEQPHLAELARAVQRYLDHGPG